MIGRRKIFVVIGTLCFVVVFLIGMQSYFHNKEIRFASERCHEVGGTPAIESDFLALSYSFSCEESE